MLVEASTKVATAATSFRTLEKQLNYIDLWGIHSVESEHQGLVQISYVWIEHELYKVGP